MDTRTRNVVIIIVLSVAYSVILQAFNYFGFTSTPVVAPLPVGIMILVGIYSIRRLGAELSEVGKHTKPLIYILMVTSGFFLVHVIGRVIVGQLATPVVQDVFYAVLLGIQIGGGIAFFYIMIRAATLAEKLSEKETPFHGNVGVDWKGLQSNVLLAWVGLIIVMFTVNHYMSSQVALQAGYMLAGVVSLVFLPHLHHDIDYCYPRLPEHASTIALNVSWSVAMLSLVVISNLVQEAFYLRASSGFATVAAGTVWAASLLAAFLSVQVIMDRFHGVVVEIVVEEGQTKEKFT